MPKLVSIYHICCGCRVEAVAFFLWTEEDLVISYSFRHFLSRFESFKKGFLWLHVSLRMLKQGLAIHLRLTSPLVCPILFLNLSNKETIRLSKAKPQLEELESKIRCSFLAWTHIRLNAVLFLVNMLVYRWLIFSFTITISVNICFAIHNNRQLLYII